MRRLFVPSAVLLVLSVVMMVASWFTVFVVGPGRTPRISLSLGQLLVVFPDHPAQGPSLVADARFEHAWPWRPAFGKDAFLGGRFALIPCWYFVVLSGASVAISSRPWFRHRRRNGDNCCDNCGYDLRGVQSLCPECGKPINTQGATP